MIVCSIKKETQNRVISFHVRHILQREDETRYFVFTACYQHHCLSWAGRSAGPAFVKTVGHLLTASAFNSSEGFFMYKI